MSNCRIRILLALCWALTLGLRGAESEPRIFQNLADFQKYARENPRNESSLVCVRGIVTYQHGALSLFIQDGTGALYAYTKEPQPVKRGDMVEITGQRSGRAIVKPKFTMVAPAKLPEPIKTSATEALASDRDAFLVSMRGEYQGHTTNREAHILRLTDQSETFRAECLIQAGSEAITSLLPGSILELTGVCSIQARSDGANKNVHLWVGSPVDIKVLAAPSWFKQHPLASVGILVGTIGLGVGAAILIARRRSQLDKQEKERLRTELEAKLALTEQLERANKELEAFGWSVSHDLRAPVRALNMFVDCLEKEHQQRLDPDAQNLIQQIRRNTSKMATLIDHLLAFSRLNFSEIHPARIDMAALARAVFDEINPMNRQITFTTQETVEPAFGDKNLIKQALENLISNAIKYTRPRDAAQLEFGSQRQNGEIVYYLRDNGVGFDMQHSHKLFGVFKRLHSEGEFEGTGAGLAITQRIIQRHNGRIWAESTVGNGAAFYFTLPQNAFAVPVANQAPISHN